MRVEVPKQREWSDDLYQRALEFHGHGGPFLVLGIRMGLTALTQLNARGWFDLRCRVKLRWKPPESCIIDGIQCSTGCTMGKHNIDVEEGEGIAAEFTKENERLEIIVRLAALEKIRGVLAEGDAAKKALITFLIEASVDELFEISRSL